MNNWRTPPPLFDYLDKLYHFEVDAAADESNHLCEEWYGPGGSREDGLSWEPWGGPAWCNPPYGKGLDLWVEKMISSDHLVVALLPNFTESRWFYLLQSKAWLWFLKGRVPFIDPSGKGRLQPRYGSVIAILNAIPLGTKWWDWKEDVKLG